MVNWWRVIHPFEDLEVNEAGRLALELFQNDESKRKLFLGGFEEGYKYSKAMGTSKSGLPEDLFLDISENPLIVGKALGSLAGRFCGKPARVLYNGDFFANILLELRKKKPNFDKYYPFIEQIVQRWMRRYEEKKIKVKTRAEDDAQYFRFTDRTGIRIH